MINRDNAIIALRPLLNFEITPTNLVEKFQNTSLRPILKLQNDILLKIFQQYIKKRKGVFYKMNISDQKRYIEHSIKTDSKLKHFVLGIIVGHFTIEEMTFHQNNESEVNRRISTMLIQRLQSQIHNIE